MNIIDHIDTILAAIGGVGGTALFNFWRGRKQENRSDFDTIVALLKEDNERLRDSERELSERLYKLEQKINDQDDEVKALRFKLQLMESANFDLPLPMWLKDERGVMLYCNHAYEVIFLEPLGKTAKDYIGKTDIEFWGDRVGGEYMKNDMSVFRSGKARYVKETVVLENKETKWEILKYIRYAGTIKIGIAGIAFREDTLDELEH